jgi:hypothetical protein
MSIKVEHAGGWDPSQYRNYVSTEPPNSRPKRRYEGLPDLSPVSKPKGLDEVKPKPDATPSGSPLGGSPVLDSKITDANNKDLKSKNIK